MAQEPHVKTNHNSTVVKILYGMGITKDKIAAGIGISVPTLDKYYRDEMDVAEVQIKGEVFGALMKNIQAGKEASIIFFLKARCGWKETQAVEVGGLPAVAINYNFAPPPALPNPDAPVIDHVPTPDKT